MPGTATDLKDATEFGHPGSKWLRTLHQNGELSADYRNDVAWLLSVASTWAYSDERTLGRVLDVCMGTVDVKPFDSENDAILVETHGYLIQSAVLPIDILVFRGTEFGGPTITNILTDASVATRPLPPGSTAQVHGGFLRALACVWHDILDLLDSRKNQDDDQRRLLYITGHSLGGALAALAAGVLFGGIDDEWLKNENKGERLTLARWALDPGNRLTRIPQRYTFCGLYTYGQPMVGTPDWVAGVSSTLSEHTYRHIFRNDWVPTVPPFETGRFEHFGHEYWSGDLSTQWSEVKPPKTRQSGLIGMLVAFIDFGKQQLPWTDRVHLPYSVADHIPQNYLEVSRHGVDIAPVMFP